MWTRTPNRCCCRLLPELPVVIWWPSKAPASLTNRDLRALTNRLIVDSSTDADPVAAVHRIAADHNPGTTDLAWTRLTRWRALLVAAVDQAHSTVTSASVIGPPRFLAQRATGRLARIRLDVPVTPPSQVDYLVHGLCGWAPRAAR